VKGAGLILLVAVAGIGLLVASAGAVASPGISLSKYGQRADVVCAEYHQQISTLGPKVPLSDFPGVAKLAQNILAYMLLDNRKRNAIPLPPEPARSLASEWIAGYNRIPTLLTKLGIAAKKRNLALTTDAFNAILIEFAYTRSVASVLHMTTCSEP
jgi:hypothetical protein